MTSFRQMPSGSSSRSSAIDRFAQRFVRLRCRADAPAFEQDHIDWACDVHRSGSAVVAGLVEAGQVGGATREQIVEHFHPKRNIVCARDAACGEQRVDVLGKRLPLGAGQVEVVERQGDGGQTCLSQQRFEKAAQRRFARTLRAVHPHQQGLLITRCDSDLTGQRCPVLLDCLPVVARKLQFGD